MKTRKINFEQLEKRELFYCAVWAWETNELTYSFMPDGTDFEGYSSQLFANMDAIAPRDVWRNEIRNALNTWTEVADITFTEVSDDGSPMSAFGQKFGDSRFGDIRFGTRELGSNVLGYTHYPDVGSQLQSTDGGDVAFNTNRVYSINSNPNLEAVALHEVGHALGLCHGPIGTAMYGGYTGLTELTQDDINGIQFLYGENPNPPPPPPPPEIPNDAYFWDLNFEITKRGKNISLRTTAVVRYDSDKDGITEATDAVLSNANVTLVITGPKGGTFAGVTDANGVFVTNWLGKIKNGTYRVEAVDLVHNQHTWDRSLTTLNDGDFDNDGYPDDVFVLGLTQVLAKKKK